MKKRFLQKWIRTRLFHRIANRWLSNNIPTLNFDVYCTIKFYSNKKTSIMVEEVKKSLQDLLAKVPGLHAILITDRDGVPLQKVHNEMVPEHAMRPNFISTFGLAIDQGGKLGLGKTGTLICSYSQFQIIQMNKLPLIVTFITSDTCNTGHVLALQNQLNPIISTLTLAVVES